MTLTSRRRRAALAVASLPLLLSLPASADVSCGGHRAETCALCPWDGDRWAGRGWCNGECHWANGECVSDSVACGNGANAVKCADCPAGESGCGNTDCAWHTRTGLCRDAFSDKVRTASVHLLYDAPVSRPAWWFQRVVPLASAPATYFSTNGHSFGYGGIQEVNSSTGRVLFSLWDQGGCDQDVDPNCNPDDLAKTIACGEGVKCTGFGGEGTGRKSQYDRSTFNMDESYYFVTQAKYLGDRKMEYTGYFLEDGRWRLLSRIQVSTNAQEQWWMKGLYSFVEQWTEVQTTSDREAAFGPSYMAGTDGETFVQIESTTFSHGTLENHERVNARAVEVDGVTGVAIATGGDTEQEADRGKRFPYPKADPPEELTSFRGRIGCLNGASSKEEIEACLENTSSPTTSASSPTSSSPTISSPTTSSPTTSTPTTSSTTTSSSLKVVPLYYCLFMTTSCLLCISG